MTLNRVMEIARLEVSMQQHLERMQETAKVNYVQYGRLTKSKKKINRVMEIVRLEVSTQQHLERMQETAKVNYVQYGKSTKSKKKKTQSSAGATSQGASGHRTGVGGHRGSRPNGKFNKRPPLPPDTCYRCGKGRHQKAQDCKAVDTTCRGCGKKGHYEKVCLHGKCTLHTLWRHHRPIQQGLGPVNPCISMMRDSQSTLTWSVSPMLMQTNI